MFLERRQWFETEGIQADLPRKGVGIPEKKAGPNAAWASVSLDKVT